MLVVCRRGMHEMVGDNVYVRPNRRRGTDERQCLACKADRDRKWRSRNADKKREAWAEWKAANPDKRKEMERRYTLGKYGITVEQYEQMLMAQGGACYRCGVTEPGGRGGWHVDHDHACCPTSKRSCGKCVRGLLCARCNLNMEKWI